MRVVHVTPTFFDPERSLVGGGERYVTELAKALAPHVETTIVTYGPRREELHDGDVRIVVLPRRGTYGGTVTNPWPTGLARATRDADVLHCHQIYTVLTDLAAFLGRRRGQPVFGTDLGGGGPNFHLRFGTHRRLDAYLCISKFSADALERCAAPKRVIGAGVDVRRFAPSREVRERRVVCVGRIAPHKGQADLIEALPEDVPLELIGPVVDRAYLALLERLAKGKKVTFRHAATNEDVVRAYRTAGVAVLPSVTKDRAGRAFPLTELFGLAPAEAMACETPVVATRVTSLPEVVADGETGTLVEPGDLAAMREAILAILDDPPRGRRMGIAGRERVLREFTWERVASRALAAYRGEPA